MREADAREVRASSGKDDLHEIVDWAVSLSSSCWSVWFEGELGAIYGVVDVEGAMLGPRVGVAWMLTTPVIERHARAFWKACHRYLPELFDEYDVLVNAIDVRHEKAIRWAERLGFRLEPPEPFGSDGQPFRRFTVRQSDLI